MNRINYLSWVFSLSFCCLTFIVSAQTSLQDPKPKSAGAIKEGLEKLQVLGSVMYFAAHPDDENTRLIAWLANEKKYRTSYLSLTRGDGGQNLLGLELGIDLGLIRTHEMLAARAFDQGEQFFSAAYDFGFSKSHKETFKFWNKEEVLRESVYLIRKFRPDVIINRFPPDERGGHGHHQASALISREAFDAAADPNRFPDQVAKLGVWKAKRLLWNTANFGGQNNTSDDQLKIDVGAYNPVLGSSYGEIAALSRSQHKSQGFGAASSRGQSVEYFQHVAGEPAHTELLDGVLTSWDRLSHTQVISQRIDQLNQNFDMNHPENSVDGLVEVYKLIQQIQDPYWKSQKSKEVQNLILACSGVFVEAVISRPEVVVNSTEDVYFEVIARQSSSDVVLKSLQGEIFGEKLVVNSSLKKSVPFKFTDFTQPHWLRKPYSVGKFDVDPAFFGEATDLDRPKIEAVLEIRGLEIPLEISIQHRFVDPVRGEIHNPVQVIPALTVQSLSEHLLFQDSKEKLLEIEFYRHGGPNQVQVQVHVQGDFQVEPAVINLDFKNESVLRQALKITPNTDQAGRLWLSTQEGSLNEYRTIQYDHIPRLSRTIPFEVRLQPLEIEVPVKKVAYFSGAGDRIPEALQQLGIQVDVLSFGQLQAVVLQDYDALIIGVRAYNVEPRLFEKQSTLLDYAKNGGVVLVQYQVNGRFSGASIGPFPFEVSRSRVTEEDAKVEFLLPKDPVLTSPNRITAKDFEDWVQERGLYFVENADKAYRRPLGMSDQGEKRHAGSLIVARFGQGKFVYTSLSLFRQLPAGVPGSYRLLMNLLAKEKE